MFSLNIQHIVFIKRNVKFRNKCVVLIILFSILNPAAADFEGFVVGGDYASIKSYPHSAFLAISCQKNYYAENWACGSSILNQIILLTAAHCLEDCLPSTYIGVGVGSDHKKEGVKYSAKKFLVHPSYDEDLIKNDLALIRLKKPLKFGSRVKRVSIMRKPPYNEGASVAGWGLVDEGRYTGTLYLKAARQVIWSRGDCVKRLHRMNKGTICAGAVRNKVGYAAEGDSGSALVVRNYIQVGVVSYKLPSVTPQVVIYTEVGYFYDWIKSESRRLYCG